MQTQQVLGVAGGGLKYASKPVLQNHRKAALTS